MAQLVQETGVRLVMVLGHTHCSAIDVAVDRWLDKKAAAWPWGPMTSENGAPPSLVSNL